MILKNYINAGLLLKDVMRIMTSFCGLQFQGAGRDTKAGDGLSSGWQGPPETSAWRNASQLLPGAQGSHPLLGRQKIRLFVLILVQSLHDLLASLAAKEIGTLP